MSKEKAVSIARLTKYYGSFRALNEISFDVSEGDFFSFLGPNGAGKTTTLQIITGLSNYQEGKVSVFGFDVRNQYRRSRPLIGLCAQEFNFDPFLNIFDVLVYQAGYFGIPRSKAIQRAEKLLSRFGILEKRRGTFRQLSTGMKKRLLLCRALIHEPKILILDEPTAGADLELKHQIWNYLRELNQAGTTILLTTHYMEEAELLSKTISIIHQGKIVALDTKDNLLKGKRLEETYLNATRTSVSDSETHSLHSENP